MDARLHLALDPVAAIRAQRGGREPDPVAYAMLAELAGAHGVSLQLRDDVRTSRERDLKLLRETVTTRLDLQLAPSADMVATAFDARPDRVTLVPERRDEGSRAAGLDVQLLRDALRKHVTHLRDADVEIAIQIEPDLEQVKALHRLDVDVAVLSSAAYSAAQAPGDRRTELTRLADAASTAARLNLRVAVAGGLDLRALEEVARIPQAGEFHVGFGCAARSLLVGVERAVADFLGAVERGRNRPR